MDKWLALVFVVSIVVVGALGVVGAIYGACH